MVDLIDHFSCETVHQRSGGVPTLAEYLQEQEQEHGVCVCVCGGGGVKSRKLELMGVGSDFFFVKCVKVAPTPRLINIGRASIKTGSYVMTWCSVRYGQVLLFSPQCILWKRRRGETNPSGPQDLTIAAHRASRQHF